jgi:hypothetical protein
VRVLMADGHTERQARLTATLRLKSLDDSTERSYANAWSNFLLVCAETNLVPLLATKATGLAYIAWHTERGTVHQKSLSNYVSAVNRAHEDMLLPPMFEKNAIDQTKKCFVIRKRHTMVAENVPPQTG